MNAITRRQALISALPFSALPAAIFPATGRAAAAPPVIETHVHLFDPARVPYAPAAPYKPAAYPLEAHLKLVQEAGFTHSVIVHPEPYQDDHRYLDYCLVHRPTPGSI